MIAVRSWLLPPRYVLKPCVDAMELTDRQRSFLLAIGKRIAPQERIRKASIVRTQRDIEQVFLSFRYQSIPYAEILPKLLIGKGWQFAHGLPHFLACSFSPESSTCTK